MLIHPSSGACDFLLSYFMNRPVVLQPAYGYHTTPTRPQCNTNTHRTRTYNPWNNSTNKSQAPEDGCINIRNMLNIKQWNTKASDLKLVSLSSNTQETPCILWKPGVYTVFNRPCRWPRSWVSSIQSTLSSYFLKIQFNNVLPSTSRS